MNYRLCGHSGLYLPEISLGLWHNFGSVDNYDNARDILLHAWEKGITHFDLANNYGPEPGSAELNFGRVLQSDLAAHRDEMIISSKAGYRMWDGPYGDGGSRKYIIASCDQSLRRMHLDYVDIFYTHRYDPNTPIEETAEALIQLVRSGKALYVGISNYPPEQQRAICAYLAADRPLPQWYSRGQPCHERGLPSSCGYIGGIPHARSSTQPRGTSTRTNAESVCPSLVAQS